MNKAVKNPRQPNMGRPMKMAKKGTFKRLVGYVSQFYKKQFILVVICIVISAIATALPGIFQQSVLSSAQDGYYLANPEKIEVSEETIKEFPELSYDEQLKIEKEKLLEKWNLPLNSLDNGGIKATAAWNAVANAIIRMVSLLIVIYVLGLAASYTQTRTMAVVTQGFLHRMRTLMFDRMQKLPIKYFDTHAHGDIMSTYTNDTDATRQLIGQSLPSLLTNGLTLIVTIALMLTYSFWPTRFIVESLR